MPPYSPELNPVERKWLAVRGLIDAFTRGVVGWAMASHLRTELVLTALEMALQQRQPNEVIHHPDQGSSTPRLPSDSVAEKPACVLR